MRSLSGLTKDTRLCFLACGALLLATYGCGRSPPDLAHVKAQDNRNMLLVVMGGNNSCHQDAQGRASSPYGLNMYAPFSHLVDELKSTEGRSLDFVLTCHNDDAVVHTVTSDDPQHLVDMDLDQVAPRIEAFAQTRQDAHIFIAGHSYGGWLAMKVVLALDHRIKVDDLYTIDPISRVDCSPSKPFGCQSAPTDITADGRQALVDWTGRWTNFWEVRTFYLHSAAIHEADENVEEFTTHFDIDTSADVWTHISQAVKADALTIASR